MSEKAKFPFYDDLTAHEKETFKILYTEFAKFCIKGAYTGKLNTKQVLDWLLAAQAPENLKLKIAIDSQMIVQKMFMIKQMGFTEELAISSLEKQMSEEV